MLKADPRKWLTIGNNYKGYAYEPSNLGWLNYAKS